MFKIKAKQKIKKIPKQLKSMLKRSLSVITTSAIILSSFSIESCGISSFASENVSPSNITIIDETERMYSYENYTIFYKCTNQYPGTKLVQITIKNTGIDAIKGWMVGLDNFCGETIDIREGMFKEADGIKYIRSADYNSVINPGNSISCSYTLTNQTAEFPEKVVLIQERKILNIADFDVMLTISSAYGNNVNGSITIKNKSQESAVAWELNAFPNFTISSVRDGKMEITPSGYKLSGVSVLTGNNNTTMSFSGKYDNTSILNPETELNLGNFTLSGMVPSFELLGDTDKDGDKERESFYKDFSDISELEFEDENYGYVKNQILINAADEVSFEKVELIVAEYDAEIVGHLAIVNYYQIEFNNCKSKNELENIIELLVDDEIFELGSLNTFAKYENNSIVYYPNDYDNLKSSLWDGSSYYSNEETWGLRAIKAPEAWAYKDYMENVKIGLIDSMFDTSHEDLKEQFECGGVFNNPSNITEEVDMGKRVHGTHVAGTMAAGFDNGIGVSGIVPYNDLYGVSVMNADTDSDLKAFTSIGRMEYALAKLINDDVRVINISLGYEQKREGFLSQTLVYFDENFNIDASYERILKSEATRIATLLFDLKKQDKDFLIINAAGNDYIPALYNYHLTYIGELGDAEKDSIKDRIICVGAVGQTMTMADFSGLLTTRGSNFGERVDVVAPGKKIYSTVPIGDGEYDSLQGTSMAAPHVAGIAGLVYSVNPSLTAEEVKQIITKEYDNSKIITHTALDGNEYSYKLANAYTAVLEALSIGKSNISVREQVGNLPINSANIKITNNETGEVINLTSSIDGSVRADLPFGRYTVEVSSDGYVTGYFNIEVSLDGDFSYEFKLAKKIGQANIYVCERVSHSPIDGANVEIKNNKTGEVINLKSGKDGFVYTNLPFGSYSVGVTDVMHKGYSNTWYGKSFVIDNENKNDWLLPVLGYDTSDLDFEFEARLQNGETIALTPFLSGANNDYEFYIDKQTQTATNGKGTVIARYDEYSDNRVFMHFYDNESLKPVFYTGFNMSSQQKNSIADNEKVIVTLYVYKSIFDGNSLVSGGSDYLSLEIYGRDLKTGINELAMIANGRFSKIGQQSKVSIFTCDEVFNPISGANVIITNNKTNAVTNISTDTAGRKEIYLPVGDYSVRLQIPLSQGSPAIYSYRFLAEEDGSSWKLTTIGNNNAFLDFEYKATLRSGETINLMPYLQKTSSPVFTINAKNKTAQMGGKTVARYEEYNNNALMYFAHNELENPSPVYYTGFTLTQAEKNKIADDEIVDIKLYIYTMRDSQMRADYYNYQISGKDLNPMLSHRIAKIYVDEYNNTRFGAV